VTAVIRPEKPEPFEWPLSELTGVVARVEVVCEENREKVSADSVDSDQDSSLRDMESKELLEEMDCQSSCMVGGVG
jgi:hypothetical protein